MVVSSTAQCEIDMKSFSHVLLWDGLISAILCRRGVEAADEMHLWCTQTTFLCCTTVTSSTRDAQPPLR